jgi:hypothetical protein
LQFHGQKSIAGNHFNFDHLIIIPFIHQSENFFFAWPITHSIGEALQLATQVFVNGITRF